MLKNIKTIEQLEKEIEKLQITMDITRNAFEESLSNNRKQVTRFFMEKVVIPAGVLGLGTLAAKKFSSGDEQNTQKAKSKKSKIKRLLKQLFPIALNMLQAFLLQKQKEKIQQQLPEETMGKSIHTQLKSVS